MSAVETTCEERRLLRRAGQLVVRDTGRVYVDSPRFQARAAVRVVDALVGKGLMVRVGAKFERTPLGDKALERNGSA